MILADKCVASVVMTFTKNELEHGNMVLILHSQPEPTSRNSNKPMYSSSR